MQRLKSNVSTQKSMGMWEPVQKDINGWLIKDGMALLYFNN